MPTTLLGASRATTGSRPTPSNGSPRGRWLDGAKAIGFSLRLPARFSRSPTRVTNLRNGSCSMSNQRNRDDKEGPARGEADPAGLVSSGDRLGSTGTVKMDVTQSTEGHHEPLPVVDRAHYLLLHEQGRGGLGRVFQAEDRRLERTVALK